MLCLRPFRVLQPLASTTTIIPSRKGHVSNAPANCWRPFPWYKNPTGLKFKKKYKKGTAGLRLDWVRPPKVLQQRTDDPQLSAYAHQMTAIPRVGKKKYDEAVLDFCAMTKTLEPVEWDNPCIKDPVLLDEFIKHVTLSHTLYLNTLALKGFSDDKRSPVVEEADLKHYSGHFLQNVLLFLSKYCLDDDKMHLTHDQKTGAYWHMKKVKYPFQLNQHVDLILRSDTPLHYPSLVPSGSEQNLKRRIFNVHKRRELFTEKRPVQSYPGFVKDSLHPYNHTVFKVVSAQTSPHKLKAINIMTGFGQTMATANHRALYPVRVNMVPEITSPEAVNVVTTNTKHFCVGKYQLNSTNHHGYQDNDTYNMCTITSPMKLIQEDGEVDPVLANNMLSLLTCTLSEDQQHELSQHEDQDQLS